MVRTKEQQDDDVSESPAAQASVEDILEAMIAATEDRVAPVAIERKDPKTGKYREYFRFSVRNLSEDEYMKARARFAQPTKQGRIVMNQVSDQDLGKVRSYIIYLATVESENGIKIWDSPALTQRLGVVAGEKVIDRVLLAGEKLRIAQVIDDLSGYGEAEEEMIEEAKKSLSPDIQEP